MLAKVSDALGMSHEKLAVLLAEKKRAEMMTQHNRVLSDWDLCYPVGYVFPFFSNHKCSQTKAGTQPPVLASV